MDVEKLLFGKKGIVKTQLWFRLRRYTAINHTWSEFPQFLEWKPLKEDEIL